MVQPSSAMAVMVQHKQQRQQQRDINNNFKNSKDPFWMLIFLGLLHDFSF